MTYGQFPGPGVLARRFLKVVAGSFGYSIQRSAPAPVVSAPAEFPPDFTIEEQEIWRFVKQCTMTSKERVVSLIRAVQYLERNRVPGAFVECGVWRGGSMMAVAKTLLAARSTDRELFLFDTFAGMPEPTSVDVDAFGRPAAALLEDLRKRPVEERAENHVLAESSLEVVRGNLISTGYPPERLHFVQGRVEDTVPGRAPSNIALLRLDTDWYESTLHELVHLFPRLSSHGVLIIDDYGDWEGARLAVDEYFQRSGERIFLSRIDHTGRIAVRC